MHRACYQGLLCWDAEQIWMQLDQVGLGRIEPKTPYALTKRNPTLPNLFNSEIQPEPYLGLRKRTKFKGQHIQ